MWKDPAERHNDAMVEAIHHASHRIANALTQGFKLMADETQALADLTAAVTQIGTAVAAEIAALTAALAGAGVNNTPAIETAVTNLNALSASLKASLPATPAPTPAPTPVTPAA